MVFEPEIFKAYDIRGTVPGQLDSDTAYKIGRALATIFKGKNAVVGMDMRKSSSMLFDALAKGLIEQGCNVTSIGLCSTPMLYFASGFYDFDLGIMITASHNPAEYNGFKLCRHKAVPISFETGISKIKELVEKGSFKAAKKLGKLKKQGIMEDYKKFILKGTKKFPYKVVVDAGNAMGAIEAELLKEICKIVPLYFDLKPDFPNHEANPLKYETLERLRSTVVREKADFGIAFDGDADRIAFVDEKGAIIPGDFITALIARTFRKEHILYDLRSSRIVAEEIERAGNKPVLFRVGHTLIKAKMRELNAAFTGEVSGHYYFRDVYFAESPVIAAIHIMKLMRGKKLSQLIKPLRKYSQSGEINSDVQDKDAAMKRLEQHFSDAEKILHLDGVSIYCKDWWCNVRPSNTEPKLRLNLEANSEKLMKSKLAEVLAVIRQGE
jgi:phosphomannomutase